MDTVEMLEKLIKLRLARLVCNVECGETDEKDLRLLTEYLEEWYFGEVSEILALADRGSLAIDDMIEETESEETYPA